MSGNISLCSFCRIIPLDVDTLEKSLDGGRKTDPTIGDEAVFSLGKAERVLSSDCPFCKLTATAVRDIRKTVGWPDLEPDTPLRLTWSHTGPSSKGVFKVNDKDDFYICFAEDSCTGPSTKDSSTSTACMIRPTQAHLDPSDITRWIANCKTFHGPKCNAHDEKTGPVKDVYGDIELMRFVDVHNMCIIECREAVKYVALSYVWGAKPTLGLTTTNQHRLQIPGALLDASLSNTISDAIGLTRACGEQFLWVDALCILQNDDKDLMYGLHVMDLIYEMSVFTIVAASGSDAGYGLPGFKFGSRLPPPCVEVTPGVRLGVLSEVTTLVSASCYATRGWTMQEEMLSTRMLYFVDDKIFFHCPIATLSEGCDVSLHRTPNGLVQVVEPLRDYKSLIKKYSRRLLTKQTDAFSAVVGLMRRFTEDQQWWCFHGIPMVGVENMMLFRRGSLHSLSRRPDEASYSWLGWQGALEFMEGVNFFETWITWYIRYPSAGTIVPIERPSMSSQTPAQAIETRASDAISTHQKPDFGALFPGAGIQMDEKVPSESEITAHLTAQLHRPPNLAMLCFSTLAVFFELTVKDYDKGLANVSHPTRGSIGVVTLDCSDDYPPACHVEFILLSKTVPSDDDLDELGFKQSLSSKEVYVIMLIKWIDGRAERRGIGFIDALEIGNSITPGPVWKEVILG